MESQKLSTYDKVVVRRLHGEGSDGELIGELLRDADIRAKAQEVLRDPNARRTAERVLDENPELRRAVQDFFSKF